MVFQALPENEIDLTLFVACYNEEDNIRGTLDTLLAALAETKLTWEIIVIDDGSRDRSVALVQEYIRQHSDLPIFLKVNEHNQGLAQSFIEGAFLGRGKYYRLICGDNVEPKETFVEVFRHIGQADLIIPYQVSCSGKKWARRVLSRFYTLLVNFISGHHIRYYNGLTLHRRYHVMRWHTNYHGFGFQADMITRLLDHGASYIEVPVAAKERAAGTSTALTLKNLLSVAHMFVDLSIRRMAKVLYPQRRWLGRPGVLRPRSAGQPSAPTPF